MAAMPANSSELWAWSTRSAAASRAELDKLISGPRSQEIEVARAQRAAAEAQGPQAEAAAVLGAMGKLPGPDRPVIGQRANVLKELVQGLLSERLAAVKGAAMAARIAAARGSPDMLPEASITRPRLYSDGIDLTVAPARALA